MASFLRDQFVCQVGGGEREDQPLRQRARDKQRTMFAGLNLLMTKINQNHQPLVSSMFVEDLVHLKKY